MTEAERNHIGTVESFTRTQDALIAERDQLRAALKEALDGWAREWGKQPHGGGPVMPPPRMLELMKLAGMLSTPS